MDPNGLEVGLKDLGVEPLPKGQEGLPLKSLQGHNKDLAVQELHLKEQTIQVEELQAKIDPQATRWSW